MPWLQAVDPQKAKWREIRGALRQGAPFEDGINKENGKDVNHDDLRDEWTGM